MPSIYVNVYTSDLDGHLEVRQDVLPDVLRNIELQKQKWALTRAGLFQKMEVR